MFLAGRLSDPFFEKMEFFMPNIAHVAGVSIARRTHYMFFFFFFFFGKVQFVDSLYSKKFSWPKNFVKSYRQAVCQEFIFVKHRSSRKKLTMFFSAQLGVVFVVCLLLTSSQQHIHDFF